MILSLEVHCNVEQQAVMASILIDILGEKLILKPIKEGETEWPSPKALKYRIIIKVSAASSFQYMSFLFFSLFFFSILIYSIN